MTRPRRLSDLTQDEIHNLFRSMRRDELDQLHYHWELWARSEQLAPSGDWQCWLICAGRGFGKTRTGAEWIRVIARSDPKARIALVAASIHEARAVMVEGESGILACTPDPWRPSFEPSLKRLSWPGGAQAFLYSAAEPESLRGPQHSHARGPGTKGILHQRSACTRRCAPAPGRGGDCGDTTRAIRERRLLARGC